MADSIAGNLVGRYLLHDIISSRDAPLHEFARAEIVVFEVPSITKPQFEHRMLEIVQKVRAIGPEVLIVIQPSLRRKSSKTLWVGKWNFLSHAPFKFHQTCSCKLSHLSPGCHLTCLVGCSTPLRVEACSAIPTLCTTSREAVVVFGRTIQTLIASAHLAVSRKNGECLTVRRTSKT